MSQYIRPNIQFSRIKLKSLTSATFSVPDTPIDTTDEQYMVEGNFNITDLLDCEMGIQKNDKTLNVRIDDEILKIQLGSASVSLVDGNGTTFNVDRVDLGGLLTQPTVISGNSQTFDLGTSDSQLSFFRVNSIQGFEEYSVPGYILTNQQNPGGITSVVSNDTGMGGQFNLHPANFGLQAIGDSGDTYTNLYADNTQGGIISNDLINNSSAYFNFNNNGFLNLGVQGSGSTNISGLDLDDTAGGNGLRFIDGRANGAGLEYDADYSTNFTNRSLVDKEYVDNSIIGIGLTNGNGTTYNSGKFDLGGVLTQATIIEGDDNNLTLGTTGSQLDFFRVNALQSEEIYTFGGQGLKISQNPGGFYTDVDYTSTIGVRSLIEQTPYLVSSLVSSDNLDNQTQITQSDLQINILTRTNGGPDSGITFDNIGDSFRFSDNRATPKGLEYQDDYSATFTDRSLVDRDYVDNAISGASTFSVDYIDFNTAYTPTQQEGRIHWDQDYGTLDVDLEGGNINLKVGLDNLYYIKNQSGSTINKGRVVRASGTLGSSGRILGDLMIADNTIPYYTTLGIAGENIPDGEDGYVYEFGLLKGINTSGTPYGETWVDGDVLYVSPTILGGLTKVEPIEPNLKIQMAIVIDADNNGSIFIRPSLAYNLGDLHNIQTSGATGGDLISYDYVNGYWEYTKALSGSYTISGTLSATAYYGDGSNLTGIVDTNFANANLTLTGSRTHQLNNFDLTFANGLLTTDRALIINSFKDVFTRGKGDQNNLVLGFNTGRSITTAANNVILGDLAGQNMTTAANTVLIGRNAGNAILSANQTVAIGRGALEKITASSDNTAVGAFALTNQTSSQFNTALGSDAGSTLTTGGSNVFIGRNTQPLNTTDNSSIVIGSNTTGYGGGTVVIGNSSITLTRLRGRVEMNTISTGPTITDNSSYAIWFNTNQPTIRVKDALGAQSDLKIWTDTNDGAGSGLDADLLDGVQGASFIQKTTPVFNKTFTLESPSATEDISIFRTDIAITVQEIVAVSTGTSPSTTYVLSHSTDRNATGSLLTTSGTTTSTTTGDIATLSVVAIPANSWIWLETTAASGTNVKLTIDIRYTID